MAKLFGFSKKHRDDVLKINNKNDLGEIGIKNDDFYFYINEELKCKLGDVANNSNLLSHTSNISNPHSVTKAQVGLSNVDNTTDINKPLSTAQKTYIDNRTTISVKDFGAKGDGIVDDTSAIQAAITATELTKGTCFIPSGTYKITDTLIISKSIYIRGESLESTLINIISETRVPAIKISFSTYHNSGGGISNIHIECNQNCDGILIDLKDPYGSNGAVYENIQITNPLIGFKGISDANNILFISVFRNIIIDEWFGEYGFYFDGGCYNLFENIHASMWGEQPTPQPIAFKFKQTGGTFVNLATDGIGDFRLIGGSITGYSCEADLATCTGDYALYLDGTISAKCMSFTGLKKRVVNGTGCDIIIQFGGGTVNIEDIFIGKYGNTIPDYPIAIQTGGDGSISNINFYDYDLYTKLIPALKLEDYTTAANIQRYKFIGCEQLTDVSSIGTKIVTSLPTPTEKLRYSQHILKGGTGIADEAYTCIKSSNDTYIWKKNSNIISVKDFGEMPSLYFVDETRLDITANLQLACAALYSDKYRWIGSVVIDIPFGYYYITEPIHIPRNVSIEGNGSDICPTTNDYMFIINSTDGVDWDGNSGNNTFIKNLVFDNAKHWVVTSAKAIYAAYNTSLIDLTFTFFSKSIIYAKDKPININYVDGKILQNIKIYESKSENSEYDVEIYQGDLCSITDCWEGKWRFENTHGTVISNSWFRKLYILFSDIQIDSIGSEIFAPVIIYRSDVVFNNCYFGGYNRDITDPDLGGLPFINVTDEDFTVVPSPSSGVYNKVQRSSININNMKIILNFNYNKTTDIKDFIFGKCMLNIVNLRYIFGGYGNEVCVPIIPSSDVSLERFYPKIEQKYINTLNPNFDAFSVGINSTFEIGGDSMINSDNYYYKGNFLIDEKRRLGFTRLYEPNIVENTDRKSVCIIIQPSTMDKINNPFWLELFRSNSNNQLYDVKATVYIPISALNTSGVSNDRLYDLGNNINNTIFWQSRTPATFEAVNTFTEIGWSGNNCTVSCSSLPTVGEWEYGDMCVLSNGDVYIMTNTSLITWTKLN